jgi:hypothetical protein
MVQIEWESDSESFENNKRLRVATRWNFKNFHTTTQRLQNNANFLFSVATNASVCILPAPPAATDILAASAAIRHSSSDFSRTAPSPSWQTFFPAGPTSCP